MPADDVMAERLMARIGGACRQLGIALLGGHTEIAYGLDRPVAAGSLLRLVTRDRLVAPRGAQPGNRLLLTKSVPIEANAVLAREQSERLGVSSPIFERPPWVPGPSRRPQTHLGPIRGGINDLPW
jgi:hydrogenase maturation factor